VWQNRILVSPGMLESTLPQWAGKLGRFEPHKAGWPPVMEPGGGEVGSEKLSAFASVAK